MADFTIAAELAERLRQFEGSDALGNGDFTVCVEAAEFIERLADRINHLTNVNDGLRETLDEQRKGLGELREMLAVKSA